MSLTFLIVKTFIQRMFGQGPDATELFIKHHDTPKGRHYKFETDEYIIEFMIRTRRKG